MDMATTIDEGRLRHNGSSAPPTIAPVRRRRRSLPMAAVALLCMALSVAAFVGLQLNADHRVPVLAVSRQVRAGSTLTDSDLSVVELPADNGLSTVAADDRSAVVGRTVAVELEAGSLLSMAGLGPARPVPNGQAIVAVGVTASADPLGSIAVGEQVEIVSVDKGSDGSQAASGQVLTTGRVVDVTPSGDGSDTATVSVAVPSADAAQVAAASVAQQAAVVVVG